jgi:hypothetical protein
MICSLPQVEDFEVNLLGLKVIVVVAVVFYEEIMVPVVPAHILPCVVFALPHGNKLLKI